MLIEAHRSQLLVVDLQERLLPAIHDHERVVANIVWMVRVAQKLGVPVAAVEQHPKGLGRTAQVVRDLVPDAVSSRREQDRDLALARMRQEGARIVSREMVAFEWLGEADTPLFREVNTEFLRG